MAHIETVEVPDIGDFTDVEIVEVLVSVGDHVDVEDPLVTLETDKASMDVPSTAAGEVAELLVEAGSKVSQGSPVAKLEVSGEKSASEDSSEADGEEGAPEPDSDDAQTGDEEESTETDADEDEDEQTENNADEGRASASSPSATGDSESATAGDEPSKPRRDAAPTGDLSGSAEIDEEAFRKAHASPGVRRLAREIGADLGHIEGSGRKGRITREDVTSWVKTRLAERRASPASEGSAIPSIPEVDFSAFGSIEEVRLSKIRRVAAQNLSRAWLNVPHVTQHDEADVTDLEDFRKQMAPAAEKEGYKLTPLAFILKACVAALKEFPDFNSSLSPDGQSLIRKHYYHFGIAVDTPAGLVVPVVRDVDQKGVVELARELGDLGQRTRDRKVGLDELQGASFSVSNLGGLGGTAFTPIVNAPEVAILGVSRTQIRPRWTGDGFEPRKMLPLSLSYDHRVIDGAAAARFVTRLVQTLSDIRRLVL